MKAMYFILFLTILTLCFSCEIKNICKDNDLKLNKTEYAGQDLRINGFYYGNPNINSQGVKLYESFIFYSNGVMMVPGTVEFKEMEGYITTIANSNQQNTKFVWGLFDIENKSISIEHWVAAQCGYPVVLRSGEILNDTTFVLKKMVRRDSQGTTKTDINQEFHFREFDIKPDSTNNFIK